MTKRRISMLGLFCFAVLRAATVLADDAHSPEKGSPERKVIMDALRGKESVVFQVNYLKIHNGWAWADVTPLDAHRKPTAEGGPHLLHLEKEHWKELDLSKVPEDPKDPEGPMDASPGFVKNAQKKFPGLPADIFPKPSH